MQSIIISAVTSILVFIIGQYIKQKMDNQDNSSRKRKSIISSLIAETECLLQLIQTRLKSVQSISNEDKAFVTLPIHGDYFRIYDSVASDLSALKSDELASQTVRTYMEVKGLFDDVKWFTINSFELQKAYLELNGMISPLFKVYIKNQATYFDVIVTKRAPEACASLEKLIDNLKKARK